MSISSILLSLSKEQQYYKFYKHKGVAIITTANHRSKVVKVLRRIVEHHQSHILKLAQEVMVLPCAHATIKGNIVRTNVYHKYIKDLKLNITIGLDGFIY